MRVKLTDRLCANIKADGRTDYFDEVAKPSDRSCEGQRSEKVDLPDHSKPFAHDTRVDFAGSKRRGPEVSRAQEKQAALLG